LVLAWGRTYGVVSVTASQVRTEGQGIVRWPIDDYPEHAMIFTLTGPKKSAGMSKRIARTSRMVLPPGEEIE